MRKTIMPAAPKILPVDMNDPSLVFYAPLWYPYDDMVISPIKSYDRNRHNGTVTEALWTPQGRYFDGINDLINFGTAVNLDFGSSDFTIILWNKWGTIVDNKPFFCRGIFQADGFYLNTSGAGGAINCVLNQVGGTRSWGSNPGHIVNGTWVHSAYVRNGVAGEIYKNGEDDLSVTEALLDPVANPAQNLYVASYGGGVTFTNVTMGEIIAWNRILTQSEIRNHFDATKWRYR